MDVGSRLTSPGEGSVKAPRRWGAKRIAVLIVGMGVILAVLVLGVSIRQWTYEHTQPIRHVYDIRNNLLYGNRAIDEGVLNLYGNVRAENSLGNYGLDYVPLRLLVMRQWASWVRDVYGPDAQWQSDYAFTRPLLYFNAAMEAASALAVFLLVRLWVRRADSSGHPTDDGSPPLLAAQPPSRPWRGCAAGFAGAMLLWFSPASQISAHAWPSWDIWVVPFYLYAVLLGCVEWWFCAGVVLGIGTMFKGQQLMVAPLFLMWPLFMGRWTAPLRWLAGYALAITLIVAPWLLRDEITRELDRSALTWLLCVAGACALLAIATGLFKRKWYGWVMSLPAACLMAWPWVQRHETGHGWMAAVLASLTVALAWLLPLRRQGYLAAAAIATTLILCPVLFSGDMSWWDVSFRYGSEKFDYLQQLGADTLPALLGARFNWHSFRDVVCSIEPDTLWLWPKQRVDLELGTILVAAYGIGLTLSALGMALQTRRKGRHFLAAMTAPWVLAFVLMPRMHSRYLLFGATVGAVLAGVGLGAVLLDILLIVLAWMMTLHLMFGNYYGHEGQTPPLEGYLPSAWAAPVERLIYLTNPDMAWAILLVAAILVYLGLACSRPRAHPVAT